MAKSALPVSFRLRSEIKAAAEKAAADDHRSVSSLIEKVLADYLKKNGYLPSSSISESTAAKPRRPAKKSDS
jgi:hypothetical protein